jgi:DNA-binding MarR family transcriptional regulator
VRDATAQLGRGSPAGAGPTLNEPLDRLFEIAAVLGDAMDEDLAARGLTRARATVIWFLREQGAMTQRELADAMGVTPRNVTGLVEALEEASFLERNRHPRDRRAIVVTLAPRGRRAAAAMQADRDRLACFLFEEISPEDGSALANALSRVLARLTDPELERIRRRARQRWTRTTSKTQR